MSQEPATAQRLTIYAYKITRTTGVVPPGITPGLIVVETTSRGATVTYKVGTYDGHIVRTVGRVYATLVKQARSAAPDRDPHAHTA